MRLTLAAPVALLLALSAAAAGAQSYSAPAAQPGMNGPQSAPVYGGNGMSPGADAGRYANRPPPSPEQRAARQAMRQACAADMQKLCADAQTTGQRPGQCMRQHRADVSPGCGQAMQAMRGARQGGDGMAPGGPQG